jgi:hypothetical protein
LEHVNTEFFKDTFHDRELVLLSGRDRVNDEVHHRCYNRKKLVRCPVLDVPAHWGSIARAIFGAVV